MSVGLIGLGRMGRGIAGSLIRAGQSVIVFNRTAERTRELAPPGAQAARSIAEVCQTEAVLTMVADDKALESVVFDEPGLRSSLPAGVPHFSLSTISVELSERLAREHASAGQLFVAAPVFGRPQAAEAGQLTVVAAGPAAVIEKHRPMLGAFASKLVVLGEAPAQAATVKLLGNFLIASMIESLAEMVALARRSGLDPDQVLELVTTSLFPAPIYKTYGKLIIEAKHEPPGFTVRLGLKDVGLVLAAAQARGVAMPLADLVRDRLQAAMAKGLGDLDWSALGRVAAEASGRSPS
jgi:3-hydroxyisobutyrate dehydrogenase-like beta-hydroxyacid dehydrogenase